MNNDKFYYKGKDGIQRLYVVDNKRVGLAQVDENDRVIKGYEGIVNFFSHLVLGRDLTQRERELYYINGYYHKTGISIDGLVYIFDKDKLEKYDKENNRLIVTINYGDLHFKDLDTLEFSYDVYDVIEVPKLIIVIDKNKVKYLGHSLKDNKEVAS